MLIPTALLGLLQKSIHHHDAPLSFTNFNLHAMAYKVLMQANQGLVEDWLF